MAEVPDNEILLQRARKGDFESLFRAYERPVFHLVRRILSRTEDAEEAVQETFLEVFRSLPSYRGDAPLWSWIRSVAASKALMRVRRQKNRGEEEPLEEEKAPGIPAHFSPEQMDLERALVRLSPVSKAVLWLHDVEGYTHEEIGGLMDRTPSFSKSQLARAHVRLRALLAEGDGEAACIRP